MIIAHGLKKSFLSLISISLFACGNKDSDPKAEVWLPDTTVVKMPLDEYAGIPFTTSGQEAVERFKCTQYDLTYSCKVKNGDKEEDLWLIYNEVGRMVLMKKELGYYNKVVADTIIERLTIKYGIDFSPSEAQENAFSTGVRKTKSYVFGGGQVAFQIGRSLNNRNELMLVYFFPEDVGATFAKSVIN